VQYEFTIPANSSADVVLPLGDGDVVFQTPDGVEVERAGCYTLGSGSYTFSVRQKEAMR